MPNFVNPIRTNPFMPIVGYDFPSLTGVFHANGLSDSESNRDRRITGGPGAWVATVASPQTENLDWHGGGETIQFRGPYSRYWYNSTYTNTGRIIRRKEAFWTQLPFASQTLIGCGIMEVGGTKYVNAVAYNISTKALIVYQRDFAETFTTHDRKEVTPGGWTTLVVANPVNVLYDRAATPMFFNESGNECQGIWGISSGSKITSIKRFKIAIGFNSAILTEHDSSGLTDQSITTTDNGSGSYSIAIGTQDTPPCSPPLPVCTEYDGPTCIRTQLDYTYTGDANDGVQIALNGVKDSVVACDYVGDTPVYATVIDDYVTDQLGYYTYFDAYASDTSGPTVTQTDEVYYKDINDSNVRRLVAPGVDLKFTGIETTRRMDYEIHASSAAATTYAGLDRADTVSYGQQVIYMDMRHNHIVYTGNVVTKRRDHILDAAPTGNEAWTDTGNTRRATEAIFNGVSQVLWETNTPINDSGTGTFVPLNESGDATCGGRNDDDYIASINAGDSSLNLLSLPHNASVYLSNGVAVCATDAGGNVLYSSDLWEEGTQNGYWNYITGGDVPALMSLVGANPRLIVAGLIDYDSSY